MILFCHSFKISVESGTILYCSNVKHELATGHYNTHSPTAFLIPLIEYLWWH